METQTIIATETVVEVRRYTLVVPTAIAQLPEGCARDAALTTAFCNHVSLTHVPNVECYTVQSEDVESLEYSA